MRSTVGLKLWEKIIDRLTCLDWLRAERGLYGLLVGITEQNLRTDDKLTETTIMMWLKGAPDLGGGRKKGRRSRAIVDKPPKSCCSMSQIALTSRPLTLVDRHYRIWQPQENRVLATPRQSDCWCGGRPLTFWYADGDVRELIRT